MNRMANDDKSFLLRLPKDLREEFKLEKTLLAKKIDDRWSDKRHTAQKLNGIKQDKHHNEILNACIFPFVQQGTMTQRLDYAYIRSSPLLELGVKNVDFLIASKTDGVLIFGEAKGTITNPRAVITEYKKRIQVIQEHAAYIKKMFPGIKSWEYVLGVPSGDTMETSKAILRSNIHIILWQIDEWNGKLSLAVPHTDRATRLKIMHGNNDLNKVLGGKIPTSTAFKTFYHESHPVAKMTLLTSIDKHSQSFTFMDLKASVSEELDNTPDSETTAIANQIIEWATAIGFVKRLDGETYKIQSRYRHSGNRYNELKSKWIKHKIKSEKEHDLDQKLKTLQNEFLSKNATLDNF